MPIYETQMVSESLESEVYSPGSWKCTRVSFNIDNVYDIVTISDTYVCAEAWWLFSPICVCFVSGNFSLLLPLPQHGETERSRICVWGLGAAVLGNHRRDAKEARELAWRHLVENGRRESWLWSAASWHSLRTCPSRQCLKSPAKQRCGPVCLLLSDVVWSLSAVLWAVLCSFSTS